MTAPLDGVIVVALEAAVAAPFATRQLADLGARVLKVERPGEGDFARDYDGAMGGTSAFFVWANRGKQSIELDLKDPDDRFMQVTTPTGTAEVYKPPFNLSEAGDSEAIVPALGEHAPDLIADLEARAARR